MHPHALVELAIRSIGVGVLLVHAAAASGDAVEYGRPAGREAVAICQKADRVPDSERASVLDVGLKRAEDAVNEDPRDAAAHFAVFCNLGKTLKTRGGWRLFAALGDLRHARKELEVALTLAPDYPGALAAKGTMLVELPRLLGGNVDEGVRLLRRAVTLSPDDATLHLALAHVLDAEGQRDEALLQASVALNILERAGPADELADARTFVASVR
jgi:tetratricopeptide (TPR) repeat protein